ncbi:MAG: hypothetical protein ACRCYP_06000 [Alphaproteobacteria bacterium]
MKILKNLAKFSLYASCGCVIILSTAFANQPQESDEQTQATRAIARLERIEKDVQEALGFREAQQANCSMDQIIESIREPLRQAVLASADLTEDDLEFMEQDANKTRALYQKNSDGELVASDADAFNTILKSNFSDFLKKSLDVFEDPDFSSLNGSIKEHIKKEVHLQFSEVVYPMPGKKFIDPEFVVRCWMDKIYPVAFPSSGGCDAHTYKLNQAVFSLHDVAHCLADPRLNQVGKYVANEILGMVSKGFSSEDAKKSIPQLTSLAVEKHELIMSSFKDVYEILKKDKQMMAGLFFLIHEFPSFRQQCLKTPSILSVLDIMLGNAKSEVFGLKDNNFLKTDPVTGVSPWTDQEIKAVTEYKSSRLSPEWIEEFSEKITEDLIEVHRSERSIKIIAELDENQVTTEYKTLRQQMLYMEDFRKMMKWGGGTLIPEPVFDEDPEERISVALDYLEKNIDQINAFMTHFVTQAKAHLSEKSAEGGKSKADIFAEKFWEIDGKIEALKKTEQ